MVKQLCHSTQITTALLLAAGTGSRLQPLTLDVPKCLTIVGGIPILERLVNNLISQGFKRLIVVIGHLGDSIQEFLKQYSTNIQIDYVINPDFRTTNNIYSLWLARFQVSESFLLVESDLVFESKMLDDMLQANKMAISEILPWMNGTTVELKNTSESKQRVAKFHTGRKVSDEKRYFKTVNLYSIAFESWQKIEKELSDFISQDRLGEYYEVVFAEMVSKGVLPFEAVFFDADRWYEIDTLADLCEAEKIFTKPKALAIDSHSSGKSSIEPVTTLV